MVLPEDTNLETTFLLLTVKDKCMMGEGIFLGESLLPLKNIQKNNSNVNFKVSFIIMINCRTTNRAIKKQESLIYHKTILGCPSNTACIVSP